MWSMSWTGMCSVTETMRGTWAETASSMAFAARRAGTKTTVAWELRCSLACFCYLLNTSMVIRRLTSSTVL